MAKKGKDYKFRGRAIEGRGRSLEEALSDLDGYWNSRPSLVMHDYGIIELQISIGGTLTVVEISDRKVIDKVEAGDMDALVSHLASKAGITADQMSTLLSQSDEVIATVDRIRPPSDPDFWRATSGTEPEVVLPTVIGIWATEAATETSIPSERKMATSLVASIGKQEGKSIAQISRESGIPRSTLRDALDRQAREQAGVFRQRRAGQRLDESERHEIVRRYATTGNAAEVARQLGLADRTVRQVVAKQKGEVENLQKSNIKDKLFDLFEGGMSASAAGRELGLSERTARLWVQKMKKE